MAEFEGAVRKKAPEHAILPVLVHVWVCVCLVGRLRLYASAMVCVLVRACVLSSAFVGLCSCARSDMCGASHAEQGTGGTCRPLWCGVCERALLRNREAIVLSRRGVR